LVQTSCWNGNRAIGLIDSNKPGFDS